MLVSFAHRFIYTKTVKTGGTSVEAYFERFCMPPGHWTPSQGRAEQVSPTGIVGLRAGKIPAGCRWWNHMPAAQIKEQIGESIWSSFCKFCVVRNPYDKAVSAFYFFTQGELPAARLADLGWARERFQAWLSEGSQLPIDSDKYLIAGRFCLDEVVRYERLGPDLEGLCARLGLPWRPDWLPSFKAGIRPPAATATAIYTPGSRRIVESIYGPEIERFGYRFPD